MHGPAPRPEDFPGRGPFHRDTVREFPVELLLRMRGIEEPAIPGLLRRAQDVQFVVSEDAQRVPSVHQIPHAFHDGGTVGTAVAEIADEDQPTSVGMMAVSVVPETIDECSEGVDFSVDVADDIDRSLREPSNQHLLPALPVSRLAVRTRR
jgi:hypothetical protein